jgi:endoglucanase
MRRLLTAATAIAVVALTGAFTGATAAAIEATPGRAAHALIRVDQVGYATSESKRAYLLAPRALAGTTFKLRDAGGRTVLTGKVGANAGAWNFSYTAVHPIDFTALGVPGTYTIEAAGAVSPKFRVAFGWDLFGPLAADAVSFFTVQRDGADVSCGPLNRKPSHLADRKAMVYERPQFVDPESDELAAPLTAVGGRVDVEGGWFDAGDYLKFTHSAAYALSQLLYVQRSVRTTDADLAAETAHELTWLDKMWDARHQVLYVQVGIGSGSETLGILGDHDLWRLPEADDALHTRPGDPDFFVKFRPVFAANRPGQKISPNLAGRVSAAFALAAQTSVLRGDWVAANHWLAQASSLYAQAKTTNLGELVTAFPHAFYPEDSWADDLELGAAELARAGRLMNDPRTDTWVHDAAHWASVYLASDSQDTLNLYDTSALAHTELIAAMRAGSFGALAVSEAQLIEDLQRQLDTGVEQAADNPFGHAVNVADFDAATRSFGFAATAQLYQQVTGDPSYAAFGTRQRNFALGANGWGASLVIGEGSDFPQCPQHQVANLSGSLRGGNKVIKGAVVNGPNGADNFADLGVPDGARACPVVEGADRFAAFNTTDSIFLDDVSAWPSVEPALDFTATGALAFALSTLVP